MTENLYIRYLPATLRHTFIYTSHEIPVEHQHNALLLQLQCQWST